MSKTVRIYYRSTFLLSHASLIFSLHQLVSKEKILEELLQFFFSYLANLLEAQEEAANSGNEG